MSESQNSIHIPEDVSRALVRAARARGISEADVVVQALREHLSVYTQDELDRACEEINQADSDNPDLQALMNEVYDEHMFERP